MSLSLISLLSSVLKLLINSLSFLFNNIAMGILLICFIFVSNYFDANNVFLGCILCFLLIICFYLFLSVLTIVNVCTLVSSVFSHFLRDTFRVVSCVLPLLRSMFPFLLGVLWLLYLFKKRQLRSRMLCLDKAYLVLRMIALVLNSNQVLLPRGIMLVVYFPLQLVWRYILARQI
ncbi:membrane hypothetical protein [Serratia proteamaculans]|nr:membrane hypothetical protein [Serratia proteamaculans]